MSAMRHLCQTQAECRMFLMSALTKKKAFCSIGRKFAEEEKAFFIEKNQIPPFLVRKKRGYLEVYG
jgi:hypothetical protein